MADEKETIRPADVGALDLRRKFNVRVSGQIEADSFEEACVKLARCLQAAADGKEPLSPLVEGGIFRIIPVEGA